MLKGHLFDFILLPVVNSEFKLTFTGFFKLAFKPFPQLNNSFSFGSQMRHISEVLVFHVFYSKKNCSTQAMAERAELSWPSLKVTLRSRWADPVSP